MLGSGALGLGLVTTRHFFVAPSSSSSFSLPTASFPACGLGFVVGFSFYVVALFGVFLFPRRLLWPGSCSLFGAFSFGEFYVNFSYESCGLSRLLWIFPSWDS